MLPGDRRRSEAARRPARHPGDASAGRIQSARRRTTSAPVRFEETRRPGKRRGRTHGSDDAGARDWERSIVGRHVDPIADSGDPQARPACSTPDARCDAGIVRRGARGRARARRGRGRRRAHEPAASPQRRHQLPWRTRPAGARQRLRAPHPRRRRRLRSVDAIRGSARRLPGPGAIERAVRADGGEPDPRPSRRADARVARQARSPRHRGRQQPVRPDPVGLARAAADGAADRAAAAAGAACGTRRRQLLLVAAPSGAPLHQRVASLACAFDSFETGPARELPARRRSGEGDRRRRLRPTPDLRRQADSSSSASSPSRPTPRSARARPRRRCVARSSSGASSSASAIASSPRSSRCPAGVRARFPCGGLGPGDRDGVASRRR